MTSQVKFLGRRQKYVAPIVFVLAPSSAGKSWFVKHSAGDVACDGDSVVTRALGWPSAPEWFKHKSGPYLHRDHWSLLVGHACATGQVVLFNGGLFARERQHLILVDQPEHIIQRNLSTRDPRSYGATYDRYLENLKSLREMCARLDPGYPTVESFEEALAAAKKVDHGVRKLFAHVKDAPGVAK